jgi:hypothetical protein
LWIIAGLGVVLSASRVCGHELPDAHAHDAAPAALTEVIAGSALIISAASLWISLRTRRALANQRTKPDNARE